MMLPKKIGVRRELSSLELLTSGRQDIRLLLLCCPHIILKAIGVGEESILSDVAQMDRSQMRTVEP